MKTMIFLVKKELKDFFASPLIYILGGLFSLMMGWLFFNYLVNAQNLTQGSLTQKILLPFFGNANFIFLFLTPLITMRAFTDEKKQGTLALLVMSNLTDFQIIMGKVISSFLVCLFMVSTTLIFPLILSFSGYSDWGIVFTSYLGIVFSILCYISVGVFCSSITENHIVASLLSFSILLGTMLLVLSVNATNNPLLGEMMAYMSVPYHFESFLRGALVNYHFIYYACFIGFFIYLTHRALGSRRWS
ncbi:MAG: ABC transporter permease subunit [Bacteriovoracaceae bacterium]